MFVFRHVSQIFPLRCYVSLLVAAYR